MRVLTIDPGVTSGYCYALINNGKLCYYPFQIVDDVDDCWRRLYEFKPEHVIIEDFEFRQNRRATGLNLFPVQLIGVVRLYSLVPNVTCVVHLQKAATGKSYYSDNVLKQIGLYKRGIPHGMDSSRHLLQWWTFGYGHQFSDSKSRDNAMLLNSWQG